MPAMRSFGTWVQRRRQALGLTRDELADTICCPAATIRAVEATRRLPPPHVLTRLTSALTEPNERCLVRPTAERLQNLPAQLTSFVGRKRELSDLIAILRRPDVRLVTLTGPGGSGKSRLALQAAEALAESFVDGCCFIRRSPDHLLAPIRFDRRIVVGDPYDDQPTPERRVTLNDVRRVLSDQRDGITGRSASSTFLEQP